MAQLEVFDGGQVPAPLGTGWSFDTFQDGLVTFVNGNDQIKLKGDFTFVEFLGGTIDTFRYLSDGVAQYKVTGFEWDQSDFYGDFNPAITTSTQDGLAFLLRRADTLTGDDRADTIFGFRGEDVIKGGRGADYLDGGRAADKLFGGRGFDSLEGDLGRDILYGGKNGDVLDGDDGDDTLFGGKGNDYIEGDEDNDILYGGGGADTFNFDLDDGKNKIKDFGRGNDKIEFDIINFGDDYTARDFVDDFSYKSGGSTFFEYEETGFKVKLSGFTTSKSDLADMLIINNFDFF